MRFEELPALLVDAEHRGLVDQLAASRDRARIAGRGDDGALRAPAASIDLAVPRDIHPACRELGGVTVHDMDDLQALVERNTSGREAEARRAEQILDAERGRFQEWLARR